MINQQVQSTSHVSSNPQSFPTSSPQHQRGMSKMLLVVAVSIVGIFMTSSGAFAYSSYFQSPEKIVQKMITKLTESKSFEYSGQIKIEINDADLLDGDNLSQQTQTVSPNKTSNFLVNFSGVSNTSDLNNPKNSFSFKISTNAPKQEDLTLRLKAIGKQLQEAQKNQKLSAEQIKKLRTTAQQHQILKITRTLASEKIAGVNTYHYKFRIDKEEMKKLLANIGQITHDKNLTEKKLAEFNKNLKEVELPDGEIWIGKKDFLPYKISFSSVLIETEKSKNSDKFNFVLLFKNFNKPIKI